MQRFGDLGSAEIGVSLSRSSASGVNGNNFNTINSGNGLSGFNGLNGNNGLNGINGVNNQGFVNNPYFNGGDQTVHHVWRACRVPDRRGVRPL